MSFPDEPYSDSNGDPITLTDGKFYIDRDITLSSNNSLNNPDNLIIEGCQIVVLSNNPPWKIIVEPSAKLNIVPLILGSGNPGNNSTRIFGCETMWGGILNSGGIIDMYNMPGSSNVYTPSSNPTEIEDAMCSN
ncbi:MAG: hypothetical protein IPP71_00990 [Bacteroidetes bacterium]|nr:hypothetical protein [Bacteroidota bacterium]